MHFLMTLKYSFRILLSILAIGIFVVAVSFTLGISDTRSLWYRYYSVFIPFQPAGWVSVSGIPERICDIRAYGAREGNTFKSTDAINAAVDDCHAQGGGTVVIPEGQWFSGAIKLKSNINLFLAEGSEIVFSTDVKDYLPVVFTRFQGIEFYNFSSLIYVKDSQNVAITGKGKLTGNGEARTDWDGGGDFGLAREKLFAMSRAGAPPEERIFGDKEPGLRPSFIQFVNCKDVLLDGFTVENGPFWTIHPIYSENFVARNLHINTWSGNTDGIAIDSTKNVVIEDSYLSTGDDAIVIKSGLDEDGWRVGKASENIRIRRVTVTKGNSGVSIGSEMSGGVKDVEILDSTFENTRHGFRIKSTDSRGGFIENIRVENVVMNNIASDVITIDLAYNSALSGDIKNEPSLKNISINNIHGSGIGNSSADSIINIDGLSHSFMEDIYFENIAFTSSSSAVHLKNARNVSMKNTQIETESGPTYKIDRGQNISIEDSSCRKGADPCFVFEGKKTKNILLKGIDFSGVLRAIEVLGRVQPQSITIAEASEE